MLSEKQTRVIQVSPCDLQNTEGRLYRPVSPLGAPMGMAPVTHVLFTRSVYVILLGLFQLIGSLGFLMQTQRAQNGSTVIVSCFPTGMPLVDLGGYTICLINSLPVTRM
jgi:hypothetical protein